MKKYLLTFFLLFLFLFIVPITSATFTFTIPQTDIEEDQEIEATVDLSVQGQGNKAYYLEGAFKKDGGSNYFGQTWNDTDWVGYTSSNSDKNLKLITTSPEGSWSGKLKVRLDISSTQFIGSGKYILKINRFTSTGSSPTSTDNDITLNVAADPTSTPTPTNSPTPTDSPTPTKTPTPTKSPTLTLKPTVKASSTPTKNSSSQNDTTTLPASILGTSSAELSPTITPQPEQSPLTKMFLMGGGAVFILGGIFAASLVVKEKFPGYNKPHENNF